MDYKNEFNSDDDFDCSNGYSDSYTGANGSGQSQTSNSSHGLSKAELRKTNKPIMEKRRRARINHCLNELKSLILEAMKKDPARHTKLEKADILEMTVKHLQSVQRQQLNMAIQTDPTVVHKFKTGFMECAEEVNRYINQLDGVDGMVRQRLTNHLNNCATNLEQLGSMTNFNNGYRGQLGGMGGMGGMPTAGSLFGAALAASSLSMAAASAPSALFPPLPQDLNNNNNSNGGGVGGVTNTGAFINAAVPPPMPPVQMGGVQLIPSRLPSGEFALIMPTAHANLLNNNNNIVANNNTNSNTNAAFVNFAHGRNISNNAATSPVHPIATSTTATTTIPATAAILPHATVPINDFAANYKRMSAFSRPPAAPAQLLGNVPTSNGLTGIGVSSNNTSSHLVGNIALMAKNAQQMQQRQQQHQQQTQQTQQPQQQPQQHHQQRVAHAQHLHHHSSTASNSPPLSPISSMSSSHGGDDSLMHTSSDFTGSRPATPPLDVTGDHQSHPNFSGVFSTPSSAESSSSILSCSTSSPASAALHLQQQQVSSTSGSTASSCNTSTSSSVNCNNNNNNHDNSDNNDCSDSGVELNASLKRPLDDEADSSDACEAPAKKKIALEHTKTQNDEAASVRIIDGQQQQVLVMQKHKLQELKEDSDNMWRPW